jgi:hypothetical protein
MQNFPALRQGRRMFAGGDQRHAGAINLMVPSKGLEPPHPCEYVDLNHARLPIPPRWQQSFIVLALQGGGHGDFGV